MYKALDLWLPAYLRQPRRPDPGGVTDILLAVCDHFEPLHDADKATALERIRRWRHEYPALIQPFPAADGIRPRHTFFFPVEQYDADLLAELTGLCRDCGGEVELHLHHDHDTAAALRDKLERGKEDLARHGLLARDARGQVRYGFIHGNWALANSHAGGRHCGVDDELAILAQTGCYADFTMPAAPDSAQARTINQIYYATGPAGPRAHDYGRRARVNARPAGDGGPLLMVPGPLGLNWERRKFGVLPRIENGELTGINPPRPERLRLWTRLGIQVQDQPGWIFIKLHTHGGIPRDMATLLAAPMREFFEHALSRYDDGQRFRLHFVTAREMVNIIHAAEDGRTGTPHAFRDYRYRSPLREPAA
jgi:hypothetical protein